MGNELPDGIYAASLTPLCKDLSIDHAAYAEHVRWLLEHGCDGVALMGTTGEATSFSVAERQEALERLLAVGLSHRRLMVGTGCAALPDTIALTGHAVKCGISSVLTLPPFYYKNPSDDGLFAAYDRLIQAVGDAGLRIYLYHFPQMSAVPFSNALIERLVTAYPDTIVGLKDSSGDLQHMLDVVKRFPGLRFLAGTERYLVEVLCAGGSGCISATVNITCSLTQTLYRKWPTEDMSTLLQKIIGIRQVIEALPVIPALKSIMAQLMGRSAWQFVRPPHVPLGSANEKALECVVQHVAPSLGHEQLNA